MGSKSKVQIDKIPQSAHPKKSNEYSTIAAQLGFPHLESISSRSSSTKEPTSDYEIDHILSSVIESGNWRLWNETQQKEFWKCIKVRNLPIPVTRPRDLGKDSRGRDLAQFSPTEFYKYIRKERQKS